jgi:DNA-binding NarL/FixJ family response regulator
MKQIYIVDDHDVVRFGLTMLINSTPDMHVAGDAATLSAARQGIAELQPDLVISDLTLPDSKGLDTVRAVVAAQQGRATLFFSMHDEHIYAEQAIKLGAQGYLMKDSAQENVAAAAKNVLAGFIWVSPRINTQMLSRQSSRPAYAQAASHATLGDLSAREFEVLEKLGKGLPTKQIAFDLGISPRTVDIHRSHLKQKLGLRNGSELIAFAVAHFV